MPDLTPSGKARNTARWSTTMTKWYISKLNSKTHWKLVTFAGRKGGESRGIVDIMAVRKDHREGSDGLNRGDVFEIILIQVKGGGAARPSHDDIRRLIKVGTRYAAKAVILAEWKKGKQPVFYRLNMEYDFEVGDPWERIEKPRK